MIWDWIWWELFEFILRSLMFPSWQSLGSIGTGFETCFEFILRYLTFASCKSLRLFGYWVWDITDSCLLEMLRSFGIGFAEVFEFMLKSDICFLGRFQIFRLFGIGFDGKYLGSCWDLWCFHLGKVFTLFRSCLKKT